MALGNGGVKDSCRNLMPAAAAAIQLSDDSRGPTCIADLDSGALVLTNAQIRPALLQLNRPLGTAVEGTFMSRQSESFPLVFATAR